jgi:hypothetical protein
VNSKDTGGDDEKELYSYILIGDTVAFGCMYRKIP